MTRSIGLRAFGPGIPEEFVWVVNRLRTNYIGHLAAGNGSCLVWLQGKGSLVAGAWCWQPGEMAILPFGVCSVLASDQNQVVAGLTSKSSTSVWCACSGAIILDGKLFTPLYPFSSIIWYRSMGGDHALHTRRLNDMKTFLFKATWHNAIDITPHPCRHVTIYASCMHG